MKSDFLLNYGEFRKSVAKAKKMKLVEANNEYQRNFQ
jgi:hypothetical protein